MEAALVPSPMREKYRKHLFDFKSSQQLGIEDILVWERHTQWKNRDSSSNFLCEITASEKVTFVCLNVIRHRFHTFLKFFLIPFVFYIVNKEWTAKVSACCDT